MENRYYHKGNAVYDTKDPSFSLNLLTTGDALKVMNRLNFHCENDRKEISIAAMQGMLSACNGVSGAGNGEQYNIANLSVQYADALLEKLNK